MDFAKKSPVAAILLAVFLGPLGLLYSTVIGGIIMLVIAIISAGTIIGPVICWLISIMIALPAVWKHNQQVDEFTRLLTAPNRHVDKSSDDPIGHKVEGSGERQGSIPKDALYLFGGGALMLLLLMVYLKL